MANFTRWDCIQGSLGMLAGMGVAPASGIDGVFRIMSAVAR